MVEPQEWERLREADALVQRLIKECHQHLRNAVILCLGKPQASRNAGEVNIAKIKRATPVIRALLAEHDEAPDYLIVIGLDTWKALSDESKTAVLDHALCHAVRTEQDRWGLVGHDVEEFTAVVARHGLWSPDLKALHAEMQQLTLF